MSFIGSASSRLVTSQRPALPPHCHCGGNRAILRFLVMRREEKTHGRFPSRRRRRGHAAPAVAAGGRGARVGRGLHLLPDRRELVAVRRPADGLVIPWCQNRTGRMEAMRPEGPVFAFIFGLPGRILRRPLSRTCPPCASPAVICSPHPPPSSAPAPATPKRRGQHGMCG